MIALVLLALLAPLMRAPVPLASGLRPGPHAVGYRVLQSPRGTVYAWYPCVAGGAPLRFADYLGSRRDGLVAFLRKAGVDSVTAELLPQSPMRAAAAAVAEPGHWPLVLVAQGNGQDVEDQAVLCEFLASRGWVVATTPSPTLRMPLEREDQVGTVAQAQADDLAAAIDAVAAELPVDRSRLALIGHSFGARSALLLAMREPHARALVSLDGGIGSATAVEPFRHAPAFHAEAALPPILHFYERLDPFMAPDFTLLRSLHTARLELRDAGHLHHAHFTSTGFAAAQYPAIGAVTRADASTPAAVVDVTMRTARFLERCLRSAR